MSIQLVIFVVCRLADRFPNLKKDIYQRRKYLDRAFSDCNEEKLDKTKVIAAIEKIDDDFFTIFEEDKSAISAFIYAVLKRD